MNLLGIEGNFREPAVITQGTAVLGDRYQLLNPATGFRCPRREFGGMVAAGHVTELGPLELPLSLSTSAQVVTVLRRPACGIDLTTAPLDIPNVSYSASFGDPLLVLVHRSWTLARAWSAEVRDSLLLPALAREPSPEAAAAIIRVGRILLPFDGAIEAWRVRLRAPADAPREHLVSRLRPLLGPDEADRFDAVLRTP